jgi:DNA-binding response OmpR family regulator
MSNILVIDDDPHTTSMLETALTLQSHWVKTAVGGRTGLKLLKEETFDIVITDIIMPDVDGFEIIMEINRMQRRPQVIAMSGGSNKLSREYLSEVARGLRVKRVLHKPFTIKELQEMLLSMTPDGVESAMCGRL